MIRRSVDPNDINPILNHPSVKPMIAVPGLEEIDVTGILDDPRNVLLVAHGGGLIFCQQEPGIYEVHTNFLENARGGNAIRAAREACRWMFLHTDAMVLETRVPAHNRAAEALAKLVGGQREFFRRDAWRTPTGMVDVAYWTLRYDNWVYRQQDFRKAGHWFHERMDAELKRHKVTEPNHADDDCHDLVVGACVEMIKCGQVEKAIVLYNRIARFVNFGEMTLISRDPLLIDVGTAIIQVTGDDFKVIRFRDGELARTCQ